MDSLMVCQAYRSSAMRTCSTSSVASMRRTVLTSSFIKSSICFEVNNYVRLLCFARSTSIIYLVHVRIHASSIYIIETYVYILIHVIVYVHLKVCKHGLSMWKYSRTFQMLIFFWFGHKYMTYNMQLLIITEDLVIIQWAKWRWRSSTHLTTTVPGALWQERQR